MRIAFTYIAEAYQLYHAASVMFELMGRDGVEVDVFHIDPATQDHLDKLAQAHGVPPVQSTYLRAGFLGGAIQSAKRLGFAKPQVLAKNEEKLAGYDAVVSTEDGIARLFGNRPLSQRPARILITHGAAGRDFPSYANRARCDLVLVKGPADVASHHAKGFGESSRILSAGYPKSASIRRLARKRRPLFDNDNPIVLYNPHKEKTQRSWDRFLGALLDGFRADRSRNLIIAPHIKMFRRHSERHRDRLRAMSDSTIHVDPGSFASLDNTYTEAADIYVGDVSSQLYEFLTRPRPCVFLNAHRVDWRNNSHYSMWKLGEVIDSPAELMPAIRRAEEVHFRYRDLQIAMTAEALGDTSDEVPPRAADQILQFLSRQDAKP